jgi:hypothetical protein
MATFEEIVQKLNSIGGIQEKLSVSQMDNNFLEEVRQTIKKLEEYFNASLPDNYKKLQEQFGSFSFNKFVDASCIEVREGFNDNRVYVGGFFGVIEDNILIYYTNSGFKTLAFRRRL